MIADASIQELSAGSPTMPSNPCGRSVALFSTGTGSANMRDEAAREVTPTHPRVQSRGLASGPALNPDVPMDALKSALLDCDFVLEKSAAADFEDQKDDLEALRRKQGAVQTLADGVLRDVDGGVTWTTMDSPSSRRETVCVVSC